RPITNDDSEARKIGVRLTAAPIQVNFSRLRASTPGKVPLFSLSWKKKKDMGRQKYRKTHFCRTSDNGNRGAARAMCFMLITAMIMRMLPQTTTGRIR